MQLFLQVTLDPCSSVSISGKSDFCRVKCSPKSLSRFQKLTKAEEEAGLLDAWKHCGRLLVVSTLVQGQDSFWENMLSLGRLPRTGGFEQLSDVRSACGSIPKALALFREKFGEETLGAARGSARG